MAYVFAIRVNNATLQSCALSYLGEWGVLICHNRIVGVFFDTKIDLSQSQRAHAS